MYKLKCFELFVFIIFISLVGHGTNINTSSCKELVRINDKIQIISGLNKGLMGIVKNLGNTSKLFYIDF